MMKRNILFLILLLPLTLVGQGKGGKFTIQGTMTIDSLRNTAAKVGMVYLSHEVDGETIVVDSAKVKNKRFTFKGTAPAMTEAYTITGFDNGAVSLFLESGNIIVDAFDARFPVGARVRGTESNDIYAAYQKLNDKVSENARVAMK